MDRFFPVVGLPLHIAIAGSMVLVIFGARPGIDEGLYVTGLVSGVVFAAYTLLALVMSQGQQAGQAGGDDT